MMGTQGNKKRRVAISLEMDWGFKHHLEVYGGCQRYADEAGWDCSIRPAADRELARCEGEVPFDGVLARATESLADAARNAGVPVVNVWRNSPVTDVPSVFANFEAAGEIAAEHLVRRGFRQLGYLGYLRDVVAREQLRGFRRVAKRGGFKCTTHRFVRTATEGKALGWDRFIAGLEAWVASWKPPIGIFVTTDLECRYLIDVCRSKGLHVSQDVAIVGCTNEPVICASPPPTLTSIDLGYERIGYRAAAMLDLLMGGESPPKEPELVAPSELIPRQSTDSYSADDRLVARALRFIAENGHRRIQVKDVAEAVSATRRTLERRFRESVGRSIAGEITRLRLEHSKRRLVETDAPLKTVAKDSGFRTADHFYKVFARVEGIPPTQYREERQRVIP